MNCRLGLHGMKTKFILVAFSFICVCSASFFLGKASGKDESDEVMPAISKCDSTESVPSTAPTKPESRVASEEEAVRIAQESVDDILLMHAKDPIVLSTGRYKLVSFRIWINPNDPKPPGPDKWLSPVWIDAETGTVVPPQIPNWESLSIERLKAIVMGWSPEMRDTQDWTWTAEHVSGFARIVVRDPAPPSDNIWIEDGEPMVLEIWVDEAREAVIGAFEL